ncbi:MAG: hypothetical protein LKM35_04875 [Lachnospiraceae bacterium]|jgi:hypothetical protein|nr:hypothetical protein [Lachnospiraceae bacterium]MCI1727004.1 hypothetical protein [Lachnospiraceae bacterium]
MMTYRIHLNTITDYRKYADLLSDYSFRGEVAVAGKQIPAYDIINVFSYCPAPELSLTIETGNEKTMKAINKYLLKSGLLAAEKEMIA